MNAGFGGFPNQGAPPQGGFNFSAPKNPHFPPFGGSAPFNNFQPNEFQKDRMQPKSAFGPAVSAFTPAVNSAFGVPSGQNPPQIQPLAQQHAQQQPAQQQHAQQPPGQQASSKRGQSKQSTKTPKPKGDSADGSHTKKRGRKQRIDYPRFSPGQFVHRQRQSSQTDTDILKPLPKPLTSVPRGRDVWDVQNQSRMAAIEQEYSQNQVSLQTAYETMAKMRDTERQEMEKRGLVDSTETRKNLTDAIQFVGSCIEMCPVFERVRRAHENNVYQLEKEGNRVVSSRAVKAFSRPAAGQPPPLPSDVRPPNVLVSTLQYLVAQILPKLPASHAFLWDRTRSIRQDFTYQNYQGKEALWCFEVIARIHCVSLHVMAAAVASGTTEWSQQQELEQFNKCLQSLSEFYNRPGASHANEPEIRAYQLLSHFFDDEMAASIDRLPAEISRHPLVNLALELRSVSRISAAKFFARVRQPDVPPAFRAICETHYNALRMQAVRNLCESMHKRMSMYTFRRFMALLGFESEEEARLFCSHYDLLISVSPEAGEEVDVRSWEESNVRDKQALAQPHDASLDPLIANLDVLKPLQTRFNPAAPAFKPTYETAVPQIEASAQVPAQVPAQLPAQAQAPAPAQAQVHAQAQAQAQAEHARKSEAEQARQAAAQQAETRRLQLEQQRLEQQKLEQQRLEQQRLEQQKLEQQKLQLKLQQQKQQQKLQQQQAAQAQREAQRAQFVQSTANSLLTNLLGNVCEDESAKLVEATRLGKIRILKSTICKMKLAAASSLREENERRMRDQELRAFFSNKGRKRVLSQRMRAEEDDNSSHMECDNNNDDENSVVMADDETSTNGETEPVHVMDTLAREIRRARECGLDCIRVNTDWGSEQGKWLSHVVDSSPFFSKTSPPTGYDVVITDAGHADPLKRTNTISVSTDAIAARSQSGLVNSVKAALTKFSSILADDLYSHRALNIKLRRVSKPAVSTPPPRTTYTPPTQSNEYSVSALAQRLRDVIAETKKLVHD